MAAPRTRVLFSSTHRVVRVTREELGEGARLLVGMVTGMVVGGATGTRGGGAMV